MNIVIKCLEIKEDEFLICITDALLSLIKDVLSAAYIKKLEWKYLQSISQFFKP